MIRKMFAGAAVIVSGGLGADWDRLGRKAGPIRNAQIVFNADRVVAFWDGKSRGTLNTVVQADRAGLPVELYDSNGGRVPIGLWREAAARLGVVASRGEGHR